jgi:predicted ATP-dependent serine protease
MEKIEASNAALIKAAKRFSNSKFAKSHLIGQPFQDTEYIFRGMYRSGKHWILESNSEYFLMSLDSRTNSLTSSNNFTPMVINLVEVSDLQYDPSIFVPMKTGDPIDYVFSAEGGIFPATNYMVIGDPGIGKSTQTLDLLAKIKKIDPTKKILFISGEMNDIDMFGYVKRYPAFGRIPTLFLCDYLDNNPMEVLEQTYKQGWDIILIDSFVEVQEAIQASCNLSRTQAEKWMIDMMIQHNKGHNEGHHYIKNIFIKKFR